jgi:hypothetical protein
MVSKTGTGQRPVTFPSPTNPKESLGGRISDGQVPCICVQELKIFHPGRWSIDKRIVIEILGPALISITEDVY